MRTVGVTGTNGKTTTTTFAAAALACVRAPVALITTLGMSAVDAAGRIERLDAADSFAGFRDALRIVAERGGTFAAIETTSESLADGFARRAPCDVAVFTNLTRDHLDAHGSA